MANLDITLYYSPYTRSSRPMWLLEELNIPYKLSKVDLKNKEQKSEDYMKIHPLGLVPAITINGKTTIESGAICMWLSDQHPEKKLSPEINSVERADYYQWFFLACNHLEPELVKIFTHTKRLPESERNPKLVEEAKQNFIKCANIFENVLGTNKYLINNNFSTADIFVGSQMIWGDSMGLLGNFKNLSRYCSDLKGRKGYQSALEKGK